MPSERPTNERPSRRASAGRRADRPGTAAAAGAAGSGTRYAVRATQSPLGDAHLPASAADGVSRLREAGTDAAQAMDFPERGYSRHVLQADADAELIACTWSPGQGTP